MYAIQHIQDFQKKVFSTIYLVKAYNQVPVAEEDIKKTAPFGQLEYLQMLFGLQNAAQMFQRFMHKMVGNLNFLYLYIYNLLVATTSETEHKDHPP